MWPDSELLLDHSELRDELLRDHTGIFSDRVYCEDDGELGVNSHGDVEPSVL